jgi:cell division septum initiation protein DivIVA|tara:strand:+ start:633 stop:1043 length:411 start_codon:yes stop_codon:yes gene_type:complete
MKKNSMNNKLNKILAEISAGELVDKITILEIKKIKINDNNKLKDIEKELSSLKSTFEEFIPDLSKIQDLIDNLKSINLKLWDIENGKRLAEKNKDFSNNFIELARSVYKSNDQRSKIKLEINNILGSNIKEVKSHY